MSDVRRIIDFISACCAHEEPTASAAATVYMGAVCAKIIGETRAQFLERCAMAYDDVRVTVTPPADEKE